jgi:copper(I)-binding protein
MQITGAWARTTVPGQTTGAAYLTIRAGEAADHLVGASVPASVAAGAMVHRTMTGHPDGDGGAAMGQRSDMSSMEAVPDLQIAAGATVRFRPGSYHVMLTDLARPLERGRTFTLTLTFRDSGDIAVPVAVEDGT